MQTREDGKEAGGREARAVVIFQGWVTGCWARGGRGGDRSLGDTLEGRV